MAATKVLIWFPGCSPLEGAHLTAPTDWKFNVQTQCRGSGRSANFNSPVIAVEKDKFIAVQYQLEIPIDPADTSLEVTITGSSAAVPPGGNPGTVKLILKPPILHDYTLDLRSSTGFYMAYVRITMTDQTAAWPADVTTILQRKDATTHNTVFDQMTRRMVHICPVVPVPWATGIPPISKGVQHLTASPQEDLAIAPGETRLNALVNPSVIPAIDPQNDAFDQQCARLYLTQFRPADLDLTKIVWKAATSNVKFYHGGKSVAEVRGGREVRAYGVPAGAGDEECTIEIRWADDGAPLLATYRAWVGKPKYIWTRANIIKTTAVGPDGNTLPNPTTAAADIKTQIAYNNIVLWQIGVQMVFDTDRKSYNHATYLEDGIFEITSATNYTFNIPLTDDIVAPLLNSRDGVFNVAYLHTAAKFPTLNGAATDRRTSGPEGTVSLGGTPSASWVRPTGVYPDADAKSITMKRMGPSDPRKNQKHLCGDGHIETICACIMTQQGATLPGTLTLAHELGHVLGLHHRGSGGGQKIDSYDGVNHQAGPRAGRGHPWDENLMTYGPNTRRQDLDIIQAQVARGHKLLQDAPPSAAPPPAPQPIPDANLPTKDDRVLLQEYLIGKRSGLQHGPYDIGKSGPDGDGVDGIVGLKTKSGIRKFQADHGGLVADGIYGPKTRAAFDEEINGATT